MDRESDKKPYVIVVILNWNGYKDTIECIKSIKRIRYSNYKICIVDNASIDGSVQKIAEGHPDIKMIFAATNLGYSGGNNLGIKEAIAQGADYVLILNNDTVVDEMFLDYLVLESKKHPGAGILSPMIFDYTDRSKARFSRIYMSRFRGPIYEPFEERGSLNNEPQRVEMLSGCCMLIKKEVFEKIGLLDENYFLYYEDSDFCYKAKRAGFDSIMVPNSKIWHKENAASGKDIDRTLTYYLNRNLLYFVKSNYESRFDRIGFYLFFARTCIVMFLKWYFSGEKTKARYLLKGVKDFLTGKMGRLERS